LSFSCFVILGDDDFEKMVGYAIVAGQQVKAWRYILDKKRKCFMLNWFGG